VSASHRAGRPLNTEPIALPSHHQTGVTQSRLLSPTTFKLVEHLGNAGRPHADANRAHTHLQPHPATDGRPRRAHLLTRQPHTGNAGSAARFGFQAGQVESRAKGAGRRIRRESTHRFGCGVRSGSVGLAF
jgi:hypothetical protein